MKAEARLFLVEEILFKKFCNSDPFYHFDPLPPTLID